MFGRFFTRTVNYARTVSYTGDFTGNFKSGNFTGNYTVLYYTGNTPPIIWVTLLVTINVLCTTGNYTRTLYYTGDFTGNYTRVLWG